MPVILAVGQQSLEESTHVQATLGCNSEILSKKTNNNKNL